MPEEPFGKSPYDVQLLSALREEIRSAQNVRTDLMKWKLVAIGALGAAAFGVESGGKGHFLLILCVIPLLCGYIDLVCYHLDLKTQVIGGFFLEKKDAYEVHVARQLDKFKLETGALWLSSVIVSLIVGMLGWIAASKHERPWLIVSSALGLAISLFTWMGFHSHDRRIAR